VASNTATIATVDRCSASKTLIAQQPPSLESNCSAVFAKDNSPLGVFVSGAELFQRSGMQFFPHSPYSSSDLSALPAHFSPRSCKPKPAEFIQGQFAAWYSGVSARLDAVY
jgi:hypothetical protein